MSQGNKLAEGAKVRESSSEPSTVSSLSERSSDDGLKKGAWTLEEDALLSRLVQALGPRNWAQIACEIRGRTGKSCRLRWFNQLDPSLKKEAFCPWEDAVIITSHKDHGNKWASIAKLLPGRTDNAVKNHWNSTLKRRWESGTLKNKFLEENRSLEWLVANQERSILRTYTEESCESFASATAERVMERKASSKRRRSSTDEQSSGIAFNHSQPADLTEEHCSGTRDSRMSTAMDMLNGLPEHVKGCLLEAARLCGPEASMVQDSIIKQYHKKQISPWKNAARNPVAQPLHPIQRQQSYVVDQPVYPIHPQLSPMPFDLYHHTPARRPSMQLAGSAFTSCTPNPSQHPTPEIFKEPGMAWFDVPTPFMRMRTPAGELGSLPQWQRPVPSAECMTNTFKRPREGGARRLNPQNLFNGVQ